MISLTAYAAAFVLYFAVGLTAWRVADRYGINGETWLLIIGWLPAALIAAVFLWSIIAAMDDMNDTTTDRAQLVTPRWLPMLLVGLAVVATILHHLGVV